MIRRNILSAVGVCAALAVGIALGGGPLSSRDTAATTPPVVHTDAAAKKAAIFGEKWAAQVGPDLYAGRLAGRRVALITLPGARAATVQQLTDGIAVAKGYVSAHVGLTPTLLDANHKVAVDTLGAQYARQSPTIVNAKRTTYERLGQIIGAAATSPGALTASAQGRWVSAATTAQETLKAAKLASVAGGRAPATLALVVVGPGGDPQIVGDLLRGLATKVTGIVVAGGWASADHGVLAGLRQQKWAGSVMTVDGVDTDYGRTAAVLGLVAQQSRRGGSYGASGIDGLVPLG